MKHWLMFCVLGLIWGSSFLLIKIGLEGLNALELVTGRIGLTAITFAITFLVLRRPLPRDAKTLGMLALMGVTNTVIPFLLITSGEQTIDSGLASVLDATVPLFSIVIAHFALADDRITTGKIFGLLAGFAGVIVLASRSIDPTHPNPILGQLEVLVASCFYAISAVLIRRYLRHVDPLVTGGASISFGAVIVVLFTLVIDRPLPNLAALHSGPILAVVTLALINTFIAYTLYFTLINAWGASRTTMVTYVIPPVGLLLGALADHEYVDIRLVIGAALIIGGVVVVNLRRAKPKIVEAGEVPASEAVA